MNNLVPNRTGINSIGVRHRLGGGILGIWATDWIHNLHSDPPYPRNALPDPIDLGDHLGNIIPSAGIGVVIGGIVCELARRANTAVSLRRTRLVASSTALAIGLALNNVVETTQGQQAVGWDNVADTKDLFWGVTSSVIAALAIPTRSNHQKEHDIKA